MATVHTLDITGHGPKGLWPGCSCTGWLINPDDPANKDVDIARAHWRHAWMRDYFAKNPNCDDIRSYTFNFPHWVANGWGNRFM